MSASANAAPGYLKGILPNISGNLWMAVISFTYLSAWELQPIAQLCKLSNTSIGKVLQMIPIMLECYYWREKVFFEGVRLRFVDYAGIVLFRLAKSKVGGQENSSFGLLLLFASLSLDGLTASNQRLFRTEFKPRYVEILNTNAYARSSLTNPVYFT